ncbi:P-loop NTPase [Nocardioides endophyticus]|uniref:P-loop NTPase n=1 Tax=Nocardioides endophyticus TaxID=1353775 RepID=A0ABP8YHQ9_9ACTN
MVERVVVLIVASGAAWEPEALRLLGDHPRIVVLKRCVDVDDLLAAATAGQADVAVVGLDAPGLDRTAVDHLRAHAVRPVAIAAGGATLDGGRLRAGRIGIPTVVTDDQLATLADAICSDDRPPTVVRRPVDPAPIGPPGGHEPAAAGRVVAVWGPAGAGRTTVGAALAAEMARRRRRVVLVDADPYGGAVAQQLGILDEVSGLLAAVRLDGAGQLAQRLGSVQRGLDQYLSVVTGLPRADRWVEVRSGTVEHLLSLLSAGAEVVVDTGFSVEEDQVPDLGGRPGRNQMTLEALNAADEVLVVGGADPVGLSRLARGIVELRERRSGRPVQVVINRMRPSLGWSEREIVAMVSGFARPSAVHFLPDDQSAVDRALVSGRTLVEGGDSDLGRAVGRVADSLLPELVET